MASGQSDGDIFSVKVLSSQMTERNECSGEMTDLGGEAEKKKDEMKTPGCVRKTKT